MSDERAITLAEDMKQRFRLKVCTIRECMNSTWVGPVPRAVLLLRYRRVGIRSSPASDPPCAHIG